MLRRLLLMTLALLLLTAPALAQESILPDVTPQEPQSILPSLDERNAVSFGVEMNVYPDAAEMTDAGQWLESYSRVTPAQYEQFGVILGQKGYAVVSSTVTAETVDVLLEGDGMEIRFLYGIASRELTMLYPGWARTGVGSVRPGMGDYVDDAVNAVSGLISGVVDDVVPRYGVEDPFAGYEPLAFGGSVSLTNNEGANLLAPARFTLTPVSFASDALRDMYQEDANGALLPVGRSSRAILTAEVTNLSHSPSRPQSLNASLLNTAGVYLHYVTDTGHYVYTCTFGRLAEDGSVSIGTQETIPFTQETWVKGHDLPSLGRETMVLCFEDVPDAVLEAIQSGEGLTALTFRSSDGGKWVLPLGQAN